ncbi:MAG TPA: dienelactone hydrolase family protein [Anaerolineales bacterium]
MNYFQKYLVEEFTEDYQEGHLSRREALKLIAGVTGNALLASSILAGCAPPAQSVSTATPPPASTSTPGMPSPEPATATDEPAVQPAPAETEAPTQEGAAIESSDVQLPGDDADLLAYLARPAGEGSYPVVLVCHENRGLTEHIQDVTRRLASAGYVALAVDLLSRHGGTSTLNPNDVPGLLGNTPPEQFVKDFLSGWRYLQDQPFAQADRVGMVGFCFGGGVTWLVATRMPELRAAVPFYGPHPPVDDVQNIQAAVLAIYAESDQRINQGIPAIEEAMQDHGKIYEKVIYPDTEHAFHNDTGPRYNPEAARDAWSKTLQWFERYLKES